MYTTYTHVVNIAFSALTRLGVRKSIRPVKNSVIRCWHGYLSGAMCIWFSWCHCHPVISYFIKIQIGLIFPVLAYPDCLGNEAVKRVSYTCSRHGLCRFRNITIVRDCHNLAIINDIPLLADRRDRQMRQLFAGMHDSSHCLHRLLLENSV